MTRTITEETTGSQSSFGIYGKIPQEPDFIQLGPQSREAADWQQALRDAIYDMAQRQQLDLNPFGFLLPANSNRRALIGRVLPSQDSAGRRYPLCLYFLCDRQQLSNNPAALQLGYERLSAGCIKSPPLQLQQADDISLFAMCKELPNEILRDLNRVTTEQWLNDLDIPKDQWPTFINHSQQLLQHFNDTTLRHLAGIRLPISRSFPTGHSLRLWLILIQHHNPEILKQSFLLWDESGEQPELCVIRRALCASQISLFHHPEHRTKLFANWRERFPQTKDIYSSDLNSLGLLDFAIRLSQH